MVETSNDVYIHLQFHNVTDRHMEIVKQYHIMLMCDKINNYRYIGKELIIR